jgi:hypothetical protein
VPPTIGFETVLPFKVAYVLFIVVDIGTILTGDYVNV